MPIIEVPDAIPIGQATTLILRQSTAPEDCFILQNGILLPESITLQPNEPFPYFPEAPGHYIIRGEDFETSLDVVAAVDLRSGPVVADDFWFPSAWTALIEKGREPEVTALLPRFVRSGSVAYDLGANIGLHAAQFLRLTNEAGYVYCFEPNPIALHYLSHNLIRTGASNYLILPLAVADGCSTIDIVINPDNHALASSVSAKRGIRIGVDSMALDDAIQRYGLRPPDIIKMDIEGAEILAIKGMLGTVEKHKPVLLFELHGQIAASETLKYLEAYRWQIVGEDKTYTVGELAEVTPVGPFQVIGVTGP
jgi:FkbM family methyltransferase